MVDCSADVNKSIEKLIETAFYKDQLISRFVKIQHYNIAKDGHKDPTSRRAGQPQATERKTILAN